MSSKTTAPTHSNAEKQINHEEKDNIKLVGGTDDLHNYYKYFIRNLSDIYMNNSSEMKENIEQFYNDIHDEENNVIYIEENFIDTKDIRLNLVEYEQEDYEIAFSTDEDDEVETNEWMFNLY